MPLGAAARKVAPTVVGAKRPRYDGGNAVMMQRPGRGQQRPAWTAVATCDSRGDVRHVPVHNDVAGTRQQRGTYPSELQAARARMQLAFGVHRRLGSDSPLRWLREEKLLADVGQCLQVQQITPHSATSVFGEYDC